MEVFTRLSGDRVVIIECAPASFWSRAVGTFSDIFEAVLFATSITLMLMPVHILIGLVGGR
jgi:hypothetical protein